MRIRLRPAYTPEQLAQIYPVPHDHTRWPDHVARVNATVALALEFMPDVQVIADLSCGDAAIGKALMAEPSDRIRRLILGDLAPGYPICGPIEETADLVDYADLWICSETIEHLDDPVAVLAKIHSKAIGLVVSTPLAEFTDVNPEHYWGWDHDGVREVLEESGWKPVIQRDVIHPLAQFQIWGCR